VWKIGELARRTGLTVRTLHHYDEIGLLSPAERSDGGHRVYDEADVQRLYRIVSLRSLGFPLDAIARRSTQQRSTQGSRRRPPPPARGADRPGAQLLDRLRTLRRRLDADDS
jgi:DNA-binding transcriptional MerR regulator